MAENSNFFDVIENLAEAAQVMRAGADTANSLRVLLKSGKNELWESLGMKQADIARARDMDDGTLQGAILAAEHLRNSVPPPDTLAS